MTTPHGTLPALGRVYAPINNLAKPQGKRQGYTALALCSFCCFPPVVPHRPLFPVCAPLSSRLSSGLFMRDDLNKLRCGGREVVQVVGEQANLKSNFRLNRIFRMPCRQRFHRIFGQDADSNTVPHHIDRGFRSLHLKNRVAGSGWRIWSKIVSYFIPGASSGIGRETTRYFAEHGWRVIATMRNPQKAGGLSRSKKAGQGKPSPACFLLCVFRLVCLAPVPHGIQNRLEAVSQIGQRILHMGRHLRNKPCGSTGRSLPSPEAAR